MICPCIAGMYCRFLLIMLQMGILQSGGLVNKIKDIGRGVINLVFPPRCPVCDGIIGPVERYIHSRCCEKLFPVEQPQCMRCGKPVCLSEESIVTTAHGHSSITGRCGRMTATGRARRFCIQGQHKADHVQVQVFKQT